MTTVKSRSGDIVLEISDLLMLTEQCWAPDMNQRPSFIDILKRLEKIKDNIPQDHHWHIL
ncbi:hypothetical protein Taro_012772 [Colocasia esculenta]|uniref:Serine-threonine/tyrosine-protein kinase catalytic domain-containing protein n=1 Tax=Colocasia esculenta TaxID=4460 RepID=A0A843UEG1_COLES|nr:hypothetical protein [Colocasia esculenta]